VKSIQARLGIGLVSTLVILFIIQWAMVTYAIRHLSEEFLLTRLGHDAEGMLAILDVNKSGTLNLARDRVAEVYRRSFSGHYYRIEAGNRVLRSRSLWDKDLPRIHAKPGDVIVSYVDGPAAQPLLLRTAGYEKFGVYIVISVGHDVSELNADMGELMLAYGGISVTALLLLIVMQMLTVRRGLKPIEIVRTQLRAMERGEIAELSENAPQEIRPLVQEVNRLLRLLTQRAHRSRNSVGNLAHALKTPLTVLAQLSNERAIKNQPDLARRYIEQVEIIRRLTDRELKRARLAGPGISGRRFDPASDIPPLISTLESIHRKKDLAFDIDYPEEAKTAVDREDMLELLGNLVDNACKWARKRVKLEVQVGTDIVFLVEDDGPGVPPERMAQLAQRGVRVDEGTSGHGLGLAIVSDTADHYGGDVYFGRSARLGGFMVRVRIPLRRKA